MKNINKYLCEKFNPEWDNVFEMATVGRPILNKTKYKISVNGLNAGERERPHFHIYLEQDSRPFNKFNFEIALDELLCYDEINIIRMKDEKRNIDITNRIRCSWSGYKKLYYDLEDWLYNNCDKRGDFIDNLDAIIYFYNEESSENKNTILEYIKSKGMKINPKYKKYFSENDLHIYKECF